MKARKPTPPARIDPAERPKKCKNCPHFVAYAEDGGMQHKGRCQRNNLESYAENTPAWCPLVGDVTAAEFAQLQEEERNAKDPPEWFKKAVSKALHPEAAEQRTPPHYAGTVTPWDLERCMVSSGNAFVDARRTDAIEYCYRMKDNLLQDLLKAKHCIEAAIEELEKQPNNLT